MLTVIRQFRQMQRLIPGRKRLFQILLVTQLAVMTGSTLADTVTKPVLIATSGSEAPVLGIPRWKAYMQETAPANCWISLANDGGNSNNLLYSTNSGTSWSTNTINIDGYLDYHLSLFGQNGDLNFTFPRADGINFRRFNAPAHSENDAGPLVALPGTSSLHRSNIMLEPDGRIWIFTRRADVPAENVKYFTSTNGGTSWTSGTAWSTGANDVRIGSMPFVGGRPALIVEHLQDTRGFEYYLWNGTAFVAPNDHSIYAANMGYSRAFTHNVINDTTMHLIFGSGNDLIHVWKNYNGGNGNLEREHGREFKFHGRQRVVPYFDRPRERLVSLLQPQIERQRSRAL